MRNPNHYRQTTIPQLGSTFQPLCSPGDIVYIKLDHTVADLPSRVTTAIVALPIAIVTSYVLYQRRTALSDLLIWHGLTDGSDPGSREEKTGTKP